MAWFSLAKVAIQAGSHIFKKRQETKMMMADAQHHHAAKMAKGEIDYQGKLLEIWAEALGISYELINIIIFIIGYPLFVLGLLLIIKSQRKKIWQLERGKLQYFRIK